MDSSTEPPLHDAKDALYESEVLTKKLGEPKPEPEPALHAEQELLPLSKSYLSSAPASLKSLSRELKPERMRLKFEGVGEKLDSRWNRIVVPKKNKYYRMSVSPEVREFGRRELHANLKKESMKWHRPPEMDYWVRDYPALSKAKVPKGWRPELPVHALPKKLRREMCFTESTEHLAKEKKKKKRPKSAVPKPTQKAAAPAATTVKKRPMSASANLQRRHRPSTSSKPPRSARKSMSPPPSTVGNDSTLQQPETEAVEPEMNLSTALENFYAALSFFDAKMHRTPATRQLLMSKLEAAVIDVNCENPSTNLYEATGRRRSQSEIGGLRITHNNNGNDQDEGPQMASKYREPWHFGKPNAYISPVLKHRMDKQDKGLKKATHTRRPGSAKNPVDNLKEYRNTARERGVKTERPWSAPARRKATSQRKMKAKRFFVNLENVSGGPEGTFNMLVKLATALKPSSNSPVLPFMLNLNLKRNQLDDTILKFWSKGASEYLRQVLVHPGVEGVDMQYNSGLGATTTATNITTTATSTATATATAIANDDNFVDSKIVTSSSTLPVDRTVDYTADFEEDDEEEDNEVIAFTSLSLENTSAPAATNSRQQSRQQSPSLETANLALEQRNLIHRATNSPPLVDLLVTGEEARNILNLASPPPPTEQEIKVARTRRMTFSMSGYLTEPPKTTIVPSIGVNTTQDAQIPPFSNLMDTISNASHFTELNELSSELIDGGLLFTTESQELANERHKGLMHQSNFRMKGFLSS
ncbi:hypothetical protein TrST_g7440 [Triparma strigata]|uniref:Uncharacterized protein n=1 Tax=Triparma strigata TaxID=1606541 RepID=A0A9W6ZJ76_9STRA|nr:hypothetical protein TrST_g7440 [Triparma strigata]